jgi:hypothetical protein
VTSRLAAVALLVCIVALPACGGGSSQSSSVTDTGRTGYRPAVNGICRDLLRETRKIGRHFIQSVQAGGQEDLLAAETQELVRPGLRVLERTSRRLRAVQARVQNPALGVYVGLFEPIVQLARLRLRAGRAGDLAESKNLERQMEELGAEQRTAARLAGVRVCQVDLLHALTSSWNAE